MISDKLKLDMRDDLIIQMLQKNPNVSQEEIAKQVKLSQPSVWARIRNLKKKGVISHAVGINFKHVDLSLAKVDVSATDTGKIIDEFTDCPYFINALITSGKFNICLFFAGTDLKNVEGIVNYHLRGNPLVKEIELNFVISTARDFVMPLNIDHEKNNHIMCKNKKQCKMCVSANDKHKLSF